MSQNIPLDTAGRTAVGPTRENNEDNLLWYSPDTLSAEQLSTKGLLYVVADGVGGHQAGEVASKIAIDTVKEIYYSHPNPDAGTALREAIEEANRRIYRDSSSNDKRYGMASTITAIVLRNYSELTVANVGDSRTYLIRNGQPIQLSVDHSWVAAQVAAGVLTPEEAKTHPQRNVVTRSLGNQFEVAVDVFSHQVGDGDSLLLCSDGLSEVVTDAEMTGIIMQNHTAQAAVNQLIDLTYHRQGPDNVTAVVVNIGQKKTVPASAFAGGASGKQRYAFMWVGGAIVLLLVFLGAYLLLAQKHESTPLPAIQPTTVVMDAVSATVETTSPPIKMDENSNSTPPTPTKNFILPEIADSYQGEAVTLNWNYPIQNELSYRLVIQGNEEKIDELLAENSYTAENLPAGTYAWMVLVVNNEGVRAEVARSDQAQFTVKTPPTATSIPAAIPQGNGNATATPKPAGPNNLTTLPAPVLQKPDNGASFASKQDEISFEWSAAPRDLGANEYYVLVIEHSAGIDYTWLKTNNYTMPDDKRWLFDNNQDRDLSWHVVVAYERNSNDDNENPAGAEVSAPSETRQFRWGSSGGGGAPAPTPTGNRGQTSTSN